MTEASPSTLEALLTLCTVRIGTVQKVGTGFFVAPGLILTCTHVLTSKQGSTVQVEWRHNDGYWQSYSAEVNRYVLTSKDPLYPDLALLHIDIDNYPDLVGHPCVYLDCTVEIGDRLYSYGNSGYKRSGDSATFEYEGPSHDPHLLKLKKGQGSPGLSGSPLLNRRTGGVCGIVQISRGRLSDLGARAIPTSTALSEMSDLRSLQDQFHRRHHLWTDFKAAGSERTRSPSEEALRDARLRLASLPLDEIPDSAPLPPGSRMRLSLNPKFVGRETELKALARSLKPDGTDTAGQVPIAAATGLGGTGKTQLASEFVHRYGQYFAGGVFWLNFADANVVAAEIASCGGIGHMELFSNADELELEEQVSRVMSEWQSSLPRLLILDNCEDEALLARWRPVTGGCSVLVTSRKESWSPASGVKTLPLDVLSRDESIELIRKYRPDLTSAAPDLHEIACELGDLPLAVHLAGSYLHLFQHDITPASYLAELRNSANLLSHESLEELAGSAPTGHIQSVAKTFAPSYERLDRTEPTQAMGLALLMRASYFAPGEPIPREVLKTTISPLPTRQRYVKALTRLVDLGLLGVGADGALTLHRLLKAFVREVVDDAEVQSSVERALVDWVRPLNDARDPKQEVLRLQPHLRAVTEAAQLREDERTAELCTELARHLHIIGDHAGAKPYYARALEIRERVLGRNDPKTAASFDHLGWVLRALGNYPEARTYLEEALKIRQRLLPEDDPDTATTLTHLGWVLWALGEPTARPHLERAVEIRKKESDEDHRAADSLNYLGLLLRDEEDYELARFYMEEALKIRKRVLGDHPDTAYSYVDLGTLLRLQGDSTKARRYFERALVIREAKLGSDHRYTHMVRAQLDDLDDSAT